MPYLQKILFPVDMSDSCRAAAPYVDFVAKKFSAQVTLLHVLDMPPAYFTDWSGAIAAVNMPAIRNARINELDAFLQDRFHGATVSRVVVDGDPGTVITTYAKQDGPDLVMMPTHGFGVFRSLLLGSITAKVLHDCSCPVWTGVHIEDSQPAPGIIRNVMCAVDLTDKSIPAMQFGNRLAQDFSAKLWLVHAVPAAETRPQKYFETDLLRFLEDEAREALGNLQQSAGVRAQVCIGGGEVANVVKQAAEQHAADLLITGRGHATRTLGRLRTHVYSIIRQSPCPVISV